MLSETMPLLEDLPNYSSEFPSKPNTDENEQKEDRFLSKKKKMQKKMEAQNEALNNLYGEAFTRVTINEFEEVCPEFMKYVRQYLRPYPIKDGYDKKFLVYRINRKNDEEETYAFEFFTSSNKYRFILSPSDNGMRCFVRARKQVVGESWNRCFDLLKEGTVSEDQFIKVLTSIVDFEIVLTGTM